MTINWTDKFSVEDPAIDEDHKTLINYFNKFEWATEDNIDFRVLEQVFSDTRKHAVEHFQREEALMVSINYPDFDKHKQSHRDLTAKLDEMIGRLKSAGNEEVDGEKIVRDMTVILNDWLNDHLIAEDQLYKPYIVKHLTQGNKEKRVSDNRPNGSARRSSDASSGDRRGSPSAPPPGDRRGGPSSSPAAPSGDRRGAANGGGHSLVWRIVMVVVFVVAGLIAGGGYWLYGDVKNTPPKVKSADSGKTLTSSNAAPVGLEWVANSKCDQLPKVKWWGNYNHMKIARYVSVKHSGNWKPYIKKWSRQLKKLEDIKSNGSAALAPGGRRLEGKDLDVYIKDVSERVSIIKCLADEAAAYAAQ